MLGVAHFVKYKHVHVNNRIAQAYLLSCNTFQKIARCINKSKMLEVAHNTGTFAMCLKQWYALRAYY